MTKSKSQINIQFPNNSQIPNYQFAGSNSIFSILDRVLGRIFWIFIYIRRS